ncbi:MAG: hypothetical protein JW745_00455 [Sedimentisphaerales bacterium]|nr:hypothetical protein [Sedimentisphaerales bacterium]
MAEMIMLAQAVDGALSSDGSGGLSFSSLMTLIIVVVILAGGLGWSIYRALTARAVPDERQYSQEV